MGDMANNNSSCIFCKIIKGEAPAKVLYQDDQVIIFQDIKPASDHHYLIVPKSHIKDVLSLTSEDIPLVKNLIDHAQRILETQGADITDARYGFHWPPFRTVPHLHLHAISPTSKMNFISRLIFRPNSYWFVSPEYIFERLQFIKLN